MALSRLIEDSDPKQKNFQGKYLKFKARINWCILSRRLGDYQQAETELNNVLEELFEIQVEDKEICDKIQLLNIRVLKERMNFMCLTRRYNKAE